MDAYILIGNANTRKTSVTRSLTGCFNRSVRDIQLQSLRGASGQPLSVELDAHVPGGLPAAVVVAAYRIVTEALSNMARLVSSMSGL